MGKVLDDPGRAHLEVAATTPMPRTPTPPPTSVDRWVGKQVDHFQIEKLIGRGGMGAVYLAHDVSLDRKVALKVIPDELAAHAHLAERFVREARAQAKLTSPNVVAIHFIGHMPARDDKTGSLYFAMELIDGEPLEAVLERRAMLHPEEARQAMIHVARGLRDAHHAGIVHRDIKPANLLRARDGWVKIADFGIAKPIGSDPKLTEDGAVLGTPLYMAPEQAQGEAIDHRADMYSLGCAFYHLISGAPAFDGPNGIVVATKHVTEAPIPLGEKVKDCPPALAAIVMRLMAKKRADRFADYDALLAALEAAGPEAKVHAGFWVRGAANALDCLLAGTLIAVLGWPAVPIHLVYVTLAHAYWGCTLPKWALSLRVRRRDGTQLGLVRSAVRTFVSLWLPFFLGAITLKTQGASHLRKLVEQLQPVEADEARSLVLAFAITHGLLTLMYAAGLAMAAFDRERRAFHDLLVGSEVTYALTRKR